jgi:hypothetical protein
MQHEISFRIILENSFQAVYYALQRGKGSKYQIVQKQNGNGASLYFSFSVTLKKDRGILPDFLGYFAQGPAQARFVYIDIGAAAGQAGSIYNRRLKIPLSGITWLMIDNFLETSKTVFETRVNGKGNDGTPTCGTIKPFEGWKIVNY